VGKRVVIGALREHIDGRKQTNKQMQIGHVPFSTKREQGEYPEKSRITLSAFGMIIGGTEVELKIRKDKGKT